MSLKLSLYLCFFVVNLIFGGFSAEFVELNDSASIISRVLHDIVDEFLEDNENVLEIWIIRELTSLTFNILKNFLDKIDGKFLIEIKFHRFQKDFEFFLSRPAIILFPSMEALAVFQRYYLLVRHDNQPFKFFIFVTNLTFTEFESHFLVKHYSKVALESGSLFYHGFFIINDYDTVALTTLEYFGENHCNVMHLKKLNVFDKNSMTWTKKLEYYEKFIQYYGCELVMLVPLIYNDGSNIHLSGYASRNGKQYKINGITPKFFEIASKIYNFSITYQPALIPPNFILTLDSDIAFMPVNNSYKMPNVYFEAIPVHSIDLTVRYSNVFADLKNIILVTPGEPYTPYEKLFLPFDLETWILLVITFSVTFIVIFIVNQLSIHIKNIVYGYKNTTPEFNVVRIFFGVSQTRLPRRTFSRIILILFVMFCLIFRTCFQSKLFEFMTSQPRRPPPRTITDLIDLNYTTYGLPFSSHLYSFIKDEYGRRLNVDFLYHIEHDNLLRTQSQNSSARTALIFDEFHQNYIEFDNKQNLDWNYIHDYVVFTSFDVIAFQQFSFYFRMMKKTIDGLIDSGVMNYLVENHYTKKRKFEKFKEGPKVLTVDDLSFGFNIWLGFCGISIAAFVVERVSAKRKLKKMKRRGMKFAKIHQMKVEDDNKDENQEMKLWNLEIFRIKTRVGAETVGNNGNEISGEVHRSNQEDVDLYELDYTNS